MSEANTLFFSSVGQAIEVHLLRRLVIEGLMEPLPIIEIEVSIQSTPGFCDGAKVVEVHLLVLELLQSRSTKILSNTRPLPSQIMAISTA